MNILEAISPTNNAVVSASAGTGKTWLLITRILRLLLHGAEPSSILAVTFTEKAAAEMHQRLYAKTCLWAQLSDEKLIQQLTEIGVPKPEANLAVARSLYKKLLHETKNIQLMTFHAFCSNLLRQFSLSADIPANFEILESDWALKATAHDILCREVVKNPQSRAMMTEFTELCGGSLDNAKGALFDFLDRRNDWLALTENNTISATEIAEILYSEMGVTAETLTIAPEAIIALKNHCKVLLARDSKTDHKHALIIQAIVQQAEVLVDIDIFWKLNGIRYTTKGALLKFKLEKPLQQALAKVSITEENFHCTLNLITDEITRLRNALFRQRNWKRNQLWYQLGKSLVDIYQTLKNEQQVLDFSDLEWHASQLLSTRGSEWVQYRLNQRIKHILVDEFQDTNPSQWKLIKPLLEEMAAQKHDGSAFIVGDIKQSIYGFRRANPELQKEVTRWFEQHLNGKEYPMDTSRRSSPEIIRFINQLFANDTDLQKYIDDFRPHDTAIDIAGSVAALPFFTQADNPKSAPPKWREILRDSPQMSPASPVIDEANAVANQIQCLIEQNTQIHAADEDHKQLTYNDIIILARKRKNLCHFEAALAHLKIPYVSDSPHDLLQSPEISDLIALLRFLCNPHNDLALAQVLRSPIFSISDEHLVALATIQKQQSWFQRLAIAANSDPRWKYIVNLLNQWLRLNDTLPVHDLLNQIYTQSDLINRYRLSVPEKERDLTSQRLLSFLNYSLDFEGGRYPGTSRLLEYLDSGLDYHSQARTNASANILSDVLGNNLNGVRLMTIHKAKGLEAAVVFLVDAGDPANDSRRAYKHLVTWDANHPKPSAFLLLPPAREIDPSTEQHHNKFLAREKKEDANIMYVALTRCRQYLFISGSGKSNETSWYHRLKTSTQIDSPVVTTDTTQDKQKMADEVVAKKEPVASRKKVPAPQLLVEITPSRLNRYTSAISTNSDKDATVRGILIHRALNLLNSGIAADQVRLRLLKEFTDTKTEQINDWLTQASTLIKQKSLHSLFEDTTYQHVFNEIPISFIQDENQYYGVIDRLCIGTNDAWIIDYKTQRNARSQLNKLREKYYEQMLAYTYGIANLYPQHTLRTSLLFVDCGTLLDYDFSREELAAADKSRN